MFELKMKGSATAMPGLYSGKADIALLGRENYLVDDNGFGRVKQYKPVRLELMNGSLASPGKADALVVYVHKDNPLGQLSLALLDAIFGCERRRGHAPVSTWGDVGLGGDWADKPIALHMYDASQGSGIFFQRTVMKDSRKMNWGRITEYRDRRHWDGTLHPAAEQIAKAMRDDRYAIGISSLRYSDPALKTLAVSVEDDGPFIAASAETIISRTYPLARRTYAFVDRKLGMSLDPKIAEFLRYALSADGQADITRDNGFLPLDEATIAAQRTVVEGR
jgi:phosphate transport system substrate-binding protein